MEMGHNYGGLLVPKLIVCLFSVFDMQANFS